MRTPRRSAPAGLAVLLFVILLGCGGQDDPSAAPDDPTSSVGAVRGPEGEPVRGGRVVVAVDAEPEGWLPGESR